jgi:hypothetical protein
MSSLVLSKEEIEAITGKKRHSAQCEALREANYVFEPRLCDGFPIVAREYFNARMGVKTKVERPPIKKTRGNRQALERITNVT